MEEKRQPGGGGEVVGGGKERGTMVMTDDMVEMDS